MPLSLTFFKVMYPGMWTYNPACISSHLVMPYNCYQLHRPMQLPTNHHHNRTYHYSQEAEGVLSFWTWIEFFVLFKQKFEPSQDHIIEVILRSLGNYLGSRHETRPYRSSCFKSNTAAAITNVRKYSPRTLWDLSATLFCTAFNFGRSIIATNK